MFYSPANTWKVAARLHPHIKYGLAATTTQASVYPDPPPHPPLEPHYTIPLSHLHDPLYQAMTDPPLWWCPDGSGRGGGGTPGAPVNSVQFNSAGTFGGSANLTWDATNGLQALGTSYTFVAKSPGYLGAMVSTTGGSVFQSHVAIGNYADVDAGIQWPGDGGDQTLNQQVLLVDDFLSGDLSGLNNAAQAVFTSVNHTGTSNTNYMGLTVKPNLAGASTGPFNSFYGAWIDTSNYGSSTIGSHWGIRCGASQNSSANCTNLTAIEAVANNFGSGTISNAIGVRVTVNKLSGTITTACGIQIDDTNSTATTAYNINSKGAGINLFNSGIRLGVTTNSNPQDGDLWYDGTHLNFRHGSTTTVLV